MNVEYLWDQDCHGCSALKHHDVPYRFRLLIKALPDVWYQSKPIGRMTKYLKIENGEIVEKSVTLGNGMHEFGDRRPNGYTGLVTPMIHLVDTNPTTESPTIGQYSEETGEVYEEVIISKLLGDEMEPLQKRWENDLYDAGHELDREPKPDLAARLVMKRVFRFYRHNLLDTPEHTREQLSQLEPELNHGEFQLRGWMNAFNGLYELQA